MPVKNFSTAVFGSALDVLDNEEKVYIKQSYLKALGEGIITGSDYADPYAGLVEQTLLPDGLRLTGRVDVPSWLCSKPNISDVGKVSVEGYRHFLENGGCLNLADHLKDFVTEKIFPDRPALLGVDHSQTAGVIAALSERYGPDNLGLIVLDAHQDAIDDQAYHALFQSLFMSPYEQMESGPAQDCSFQCGNFIKYLLRQNLIRPENIVFIGLNDLPQIASYPGAQITEFMTAYNSIQQQGATLISKAQLAREFSSFTGALNKLKVPFYYLSVDLDVGSLACVHAARFMNAEGLSEPMLHSILAGIEEWAVKSGSRCAGFDLMEMDIHLAGSPWDQTFEVASRLFSRIAKLK